MKSFRMKTPLVFLYILVFLNCAISEDDCPDILIDARNKLSDLEDRFESCREELIDYQSLDGKRDTDFENLLQHWHKAIGSLEEYKKREIAATAEIEQLKSDSEKAKDLYLEKEAEMAQKIALLESEGSICEVDESKVDENIAREMERLRKAKETAEESSGVIFEKLQDLLQSHSKLNDLYLIGEDRIFELENENKKLDGQLFDIKLKYRELNHLSENIKDCIEQLERTKHNLDRRNELMQKCAKGSNKCMDLKKEITASLDTCIKEREEYHTQLEEIDQEQLEDQVKLCKSEIQLLLEKEEKLTNEKDGLSNQIKECQEIRTKLNDLSERETMGSFNERTVSENTRLQDCELALRRNEEENLSMVKTLLNKKAKEAENIITQLHEAKKETQMRLSSCEFSLQIKEQELTAGREFIKQNTEKLDEIHETKEMLHNHEEKKQPTFYSSKSPLELCTQRLEEVMHNTNTIISSNEEKIDKLNETLSKCLSEKDQVNMVNGGLQMILDQMKPKHKAEKDEHKKEIHAMYLQLDQADKDAGRYMKSFGVTLAILIAIVVSLLVKCLMNRYDEDLKSTRQQKSKEKEERKTKKYGHKQK